MIEKILEVDELVIHIVRFYNDEYCHMSGHDIQQFVYFEIQYYRNYCTR